MKRIFLLALTLCIIFPDMTYAQRRPKDPDAAIIAVAVAECVKNLAFTIEVTRAVATNSATVNATGARLTIVEGIVSARLPHYGTGSSSSAFGSEGDRAIIFERCPVEAELDTSKEKRGRYTVSFTARSGNSNCDVSITIWTDRTATIVCSPMDRSQMTYYGYITSNTSELVN